MIRSTINNEQWYKSMLAGNASIVLGDFELITTTLVPSAVSDVTFSSLATYASTYKHLQIRIVARTDRASYVDSAMIQFNADTGTNYRAHYLIGNGTTVTSGADPQGDRIYAARISGNNGGTSVFGSGVCDILDAYSSTKNTTTRSLTGYNTSSGSEIYVFSGLWLNTNSLTSIKLFPNVGTNFVTGSRFSLYGIRG
jgi:hypothetical protein